MATVTTTSFELTGADGGPLRGEIRSQSLSESRPAVVICHGFKGFKDWGFFPYLAERIARAGITAVSFNFSGSGVGPDGESFSEPERFGHNTYTKELRDLETVIGEVLKGELGPGMVTPSRLGLFGHSRGGVAVIRYCGTHPAEVSALVTWAAVGNPMRWGPETLKQWRRDGQIEIVNARTGEVLPLYTDLLEDLEKNSESLNLPELARRIDVPWLILHGAVDEAVPPAEAEMLSEAAGANSECHIIPRGSHTFGARHPWAGSTPELDEAFDRTVSWFSKHLF